MAVVIVIGAHARASGEAEVPEAVAPLFRPPAEFVGVLGPFKSPLFFNDGRPVRSADDWRERRREILETWHEVMGPWPPLIERPEMEVLEEHAGDGFTRRRVRLKVAPDRTTDGYLLVPDGPGPFPAMLVVFYEPETAIGQGKRRGGSTSPIQLARRGIAALSIGFDPGGIDPAKSGIMLQPLSYLAYVAANGYNALASLPEIDPDRIGVMGHSYGGKWAMFASCLYEKFACGVWSDPGIMFDEARSNVNYWEPWYLGWEPGRTRKRGVITPESPRTGAYKRLVESGHDLHELHALMAPRPFLVSGGSEDPPERWSALNHTVAVNKLLGHENRVAMTNRPGHAPTAESNEQILRFLDHVLKPGRAVQDPKGSQ